MGKSRIGKRRARATRPASFLPNSAKTQFRKKTYGKSGALFSVNRLSDAEAQIGSLASVSSAERWSGNPEPTNMRLPNGWGATGNRCTCMTFIYGRRPSNGSAPDTVLGHYHDIPSG